MSDRLARSTTTLTVCVGCLSSRKRYSTKGAVRETVTSGQLGNPDDVNTGASRLDQPWEMILSQMESLRNVLDKMDKRLESVERHLQVRPLVGSEKRWRGGGKGGGVPETEYIPDSDYVDGPEDCHDGEGEE